MNLPRINLGNLLENSDHREGSIVPGVSSLGNSTKVVIIPSDPAIEALEAPMEDERWQDEPSVVDQYVNPKYRSYCRLGPLSEEVYDLGKSDDKAAFNDLLKLRDPEGAPRVNFEFEREQFSSVSNSWMRLVRFRRVQYRQILPSRSEPLLRKLPNTHFIIA